MRLREGRGETTRSPPTTYASRTASQAVHYNSNHAAPESARGETHGRPLAINRAKWGMVVVVMVVGGVLHRTTHAAIIDTSLCMSAKRERTDGAKTMAGVFAGQGLHFTEAIPSCCTVISIVNTTLTMLLVLQYAEPGVTGRAGWGMGPLGFPTGKYSHPARTFLSRRTRRTRGPQPRCLE